MGIILIETSAGGIILGLLNDDIVDKIRSAPHLLVKQQIQIESFGDIV